MENEEQIGRERRKQLAESPELRTYMEKLRERLPSFSRRAAAISPEEPGSVEWLGRIGKFWWKAREEAGLDRHEFAERSGQDLHSIMFFEAGLMNPDELKNLPVHYTQIIGTPELFDKYCEQFDITPAG